MADNILLLKRQIKHDVKNGIFRRYKIYLLFIILLSVILAFWNKKISLNMVNKAGLIDYLMYIFSGKEEVGKLTNQDIFDIPIAWLFVHIYVLFGIGTYPKTEYVERGYQFLIRAGNKWCWWLGKCVYIFISVIFYYLCIIFTSFIFSALNDSSHNEVNKEICERILRLDINNITDMKRYLCLVIMPLLLFMVLGFVCMFISFLQNNIVAVIVLIGYLSISAYWCNDLLLGNYTMLLRVHKISFAVGIIVSAIVLLLSGFGGYRYFRNMDVYGREQEEM
ncbi:MAG: hypothetical protein ACTTKP_03520 [Catonella sp.]|uniref:hypothetical protein n=1 Tax=Catonella sp. TaxID=2382125 RepID=UPI003FA0813C